MSWLVKFWFPSQQKEGNTRLARRFLQLSCAAWLWINERRHWLGSQKYGVLRAQGLQTPRLTTKPWPCCASHLTPLSKGHNAYVVLLLRPKLLSAKLGQLLAVQRLKETETVPLSKYSNTIGQHTVTRTAMENFLSDTLHSGSGLDYKCLILQILDRGVSKKKAWQ